MRRRACTGPEVAPIGPDLRGSGTRSRDTYLDHLPGKRVEDQHDCASPMGAPGERGRLAEGSLRSVQLRTSGERFVYPAVLRLKHAVLEEGQPATGGRAGLSGLRRIPSARLDRRRVRTSVKRLGPGGDAEDPAGIPGVSPYTASSRSIAMGLTAFLVFIVPWALLALWLTRTPTALRLGAPAAPWRVIPTHRDLARAQRSETNPHGKRAADSSGSTNGGRLDRTEMSDGGALHTSVEPTEPTA